MDNQDILPVLSRVEERVSNILERQEQLFHSIDKLMDNHNNLAGRVQVIEARNGNSLEDLKQSQSKNETRLTILEMRSNSNLVLWSKIGDTFFKFVFGIVMAYLLFRFGWK